METLGFVISFATCQPENRSESCRGGATQCAAGLAAQVSAPSEVDFYANPPPPSTTSAACIKLLPVLTSTRVLVKVLGRVLEYINTR